MIFESINYSWLLQDFLFSIVAGFITAIFNQIIGIFLYKGKVRLFIRDILTCIFFSIILYSFIISFANYKIFRIYHIFAGIIGLFCFNVKFSEIFHNFFDKIIVRIKNKILCFVKKKYTTICILRSKKKEEHQKQTKTDKKDHLKTDDVYVYNI